jgi:hypothetical protein
MSIRATSFFLLLCLMAACNSPSKTDSAAVSVSSGSPTTGTKPKVWDDKMQGLSVTLSELLPLVASRTKFNDPANFEKIESRARDLRTLSHDLKNTHAPNSDPMMEIMSGMMSDDIERALDTLRGGNRDYARLVLKDTTSYCFQCHTQTSADAAGRSSALRLNINVNTKSLSPLDQAEFFAATQQFDQSLAAYREALTDSRLAKNDAFAWEQAARSAIAIIVRVKNNPNEAAALIAQLEKQADLPASMKKSIANWKTSVRDWQHEPVKVPTGTELDRASKLIEAALKHQEFPLDHSQDIVFFRASRLVHDFLQKQRLHEAAGAKALYLAGVVAESTRDMNFWTLHETYYEQCIRWLPHSKQAEECFDRLKDSITLGYSGSSGVNVPIEVAKRMQMFRTLADADPATELRTSHPADSK